MTQWFDRLRFLWEEEVAPPAEVTRTGREAPTGVPRPLRRATRFALIGAVSVSVMAQVVEVRLGPGVGVSLASCIIDGQHACEFHIIRTPVELRTKKSEITSVGIPE